MVVVDMVLPVPILMVVIWELSMAWAWARHVAEEVEKSLMVVEPVAVAVVVEVAVAVEATALRPALPMAALPAEGEVAVPEVDRMLTEAEVLTVIQVVVCRDVTVAAGGNTEPLMVIMVHRAQFLWLLFQLQKVHRFFWMNYPCE